MQLSVKLPDLRKAGLETQPGLVCLFLLLTNIFSYYLDGGVNPPRYYYTHEEIEETCRAAGVEPPPRYVDEDEDTAGYHEVTDNLHTQIGGVPSIKFLAHASIIITDCLLF